MGEKTVMAQNNFKPFAIGNNANVTAQTDYEALAALSTGFQSGKASSAQINKALRQSTTITSVIAQYIANTSGADVLDNGDTAGMLANLLLAIQQSTKNYAPQVVTGVVGTSRNLAMNVTTASATATITADEIIVETAIGGGQYRIGSFNKQINLATTGAGGMDTGTVPANGFVGIYAIYNPTTGASALLGVNAAAVIGEVYGGNNMPAGYSASALLTIVPTASSQFKIFTVVGRSVYSGTSTILSTSSNLTPTQISISSIAPLNSKLIEGLIALGSTAAGTLSVTLNSSNASQGIRQFGAYTPASASVSSGYTGMPITIPGYIYVSTSNATSGTGSFVIYCSGYTI